jgi:amidase
MLDLVELSAADLQALQTEGSITAYELVKQCLQQIEKYDNQGPKLRAMIAIAPEENTLQRAAFLDEERVAGRVRGPLHGIPVILKVVSFESVMK